MKKAAAWTIVLFLAMAGVAFAMTAQSESEIELAPNLGTYAGIAALTTIAIGAIKKFWPNWTKGKEPFLAIGIPIVLGTDAHAVEELRFMQYGVYQARRAGLEARDVANTLTLARFRKLIGRKRPSAALP